MNCRKQFNSKPGQLHLQITIDRNANPTLSNLTIYSNNSRTDYAMAGHLLNITITANEALKTANVTVFGITSMMIVNGTTASANVTVDENSAEGVVSFNITAFDLAGNSLTVNQTQLNSSNLTIDQTNPTLSNLTIYSNNHNTSLAIVMFGESSCAWFTVRLFPARFAVMLNSLCHQRELHLLLHLRLLPLR